MARCKDIDAIDVLSRRAVLKGIAFAPAALRIAPFLYGPSLGALSRPAASPFPFADLRFAPRYPVQPPLAEVMARMAPGADEYKLEKAADDIEAILRIWGHELRNSKSNVSKLALWTDSQIHCSAMRPASEKLVRSAYGIDVLRRGFTPEMTSGRENAVQSMQTWLSGAAQVETTEFEIYRIERTADSPFAVRCEIRYDIVWVRRDQRREERVGSWMMEWVEADPGSWKARHWESTEETQCVADGPAFVDVTHHALGETNSYQKQLLHGADYWRTVLDGAVGTDVYCNNGVAVGDYNNDGFDDLYVCQPAGLPNRLYRNKGDGSFEDVTEKSGVGVLDNTACALFADFQNRGQQDLLVVCGTGPLLFVNQGNGTFALKRDAFKFARQPQGTFTHAALADYDGDGRLDIYFCLYMYYLGLDQYHYPIPYYDARNGPPNCLFHNQGEGTFVESTEAAGLHIDNDRYSFACAWGDSNGNGLPDLFVANDFGSSQLYRNNGNGTFTVISSQAHVESVGAGMSCCWCDYDNDGHQDLYVPSMWEAAGQRVSNQMQFHAKAASNIRELYQRHARGNALYHNGGNGVFENVASRAGVEMGRWSWCSDFWDFDHDGHSDLYVANGYLSGPDRYDLASFFWRQVVAQSPEDATPSQAYERGWNAINELVRSDHTWHGYARNVLFVNCGNGTFCEGSGALGMDFLEDGRSFALADLDHDGRLEVILKNRNAPQIRVLHNAMKDIGGSISFRLGGRQSNRDAIGASVTVKAGDLRQTKYVQAGSGFLAQHSKELFFGVGKQTGAITASIQWPNGRKQEFRELPTGHRIMIEEGSEHYEVEPYVARTSLGGSHQAPPAMERLPDEVETWLVQPLKSPDFSLPGVDGKPIRLAAFRSHLVLLVFWSVSSSSSIDVLRRLHRSRSRRDQGEPAILAINLDRDSGAEEARANARQEDFAFPVLFASEEVAGIYNIIYRHLFDRRRDLGIPTGFLIDGDGMIVKVYQGTIDAEHLYTDARSIPLAPSQRIRQALPFEGMLGQDTFARNDFTYGVAMFQHGYLEQAAESFRQVIASKPDNADAHYNLGTLSLRRHDLQQARQALETAVKLQPNYPEAWNNLGMLAAEEGDADEAIAALQKSIEQRPRFAIALLNLGNVYRKEGKTDRAEEYLVRAWRSLPDDPEINYSLGMLYARRDELSTASQFLRKALELHPDYPEALNNLGILLVRQHEYPKAEEQFRNSIRVAPTFEQAYLNLARLYRLEEDTGRARQVLFELLQAQPENRAAQEALEMLR